MKDERLINIINEVILSEASDLERYQEIKAELEPLELGELKQKAEEYEKKYRDYNRLGMWSEADEMATYYYTAKEIIDTKKREVVDATAEKLKGQPFLGSTIEDFNAPSYDGSETLKIWLADEGEFEYEFSGRLPQFKYFDAQNEYYTQYTNRPVNPDEALLDENDMKILNLIIRWNNSQAMDTKYKVPYPRNATLKGGSNPTPPPLEEKDFAFLKGQVSVKDANKEITEYSFTNGTTTDGYGSGGYMLLYIHVGKNWYDTETYSYSAQFDAYFKPTGEEFKHRFGMTSTTESETTHIDKGLYEPIMKSVQMINPKSKYLKSVWMNNH